MSDERVELNDTRGMYASSEVGKRENDQDFIACKKIDTKAGWYVRIGVLCDGMGGGEQGEVVSERSANAFIKTLEDELYKVEQHSFFNRLLSFFGPPEKLGDWDSEEFRHSHHSRAIDACHTIVEEIEDKDKNTGTTLTALVTYYSPKGKPLMADLVHIGDCRAYRLAEEPAACELLTRDHSATGDMVRAGYIELHEISETPGSSTLTRHIGHEEKMGPEISTVQVKKKEKFLLCCDGVWEPLHDEEGLWLPAKAQGQVTVNLFVSEALERGSTDNCSALFIYI